MHKRSPKTDLFAQLPRELKTAMRQSHWRAEVQRTEALLAALDVPVKTRSKLGGQLDVVVMLLDFNWHVCTTEATDHLRAVRRNMRAFGVEGRDDE